MTLNDWWILLIPLLGTTLGAACVLFMKQQIRPAMERGLSGFAAGVMVAASIWSLLIPAMDQSHDMGGWAFVPAVTGFWGGILFLLLLDNIIPHLHSHGKEAEGPKSGLKRTTKLVLAITLHNIPEGMAVGVAFGSLAYSLTGSTLASALTLALGIGLQNFPEGSAVNFPEGAIVSMPLRSVGASRKKAFAYGTLSGIVEPLGALITIALAALITPYLPYMLSFAAGAMIYVVVEELIPEMSGGQHSNVGTLMFALGFSLMMVLDVALG